MFRQRGESRRINTADKYGREAYHKIKLGSDFEIAINSIRHCLEIRNQYAHFHWYDDNTGNLAFTNLEEIAKEDTPLSIDTLETLTIHHLNIPVLSDQESYFEYTDNLLAWLNYEGLRLVDKPHILQGEAPKRLEPPALYIQEGLGSKLEQ